MCVMRRRIHVCPVRACVTCNQSVLCECVGSTEQSKARSKQSAAAATSAAAAAAAGTAAFDQQCATAHTK